MRIRLLVPVTLLAGLLSISPAYASAFNATFAGWETATNLYPDEVSAEFPVPVVTPSGSGLVDWIGLGGGSSVLQAGAGSLGGGVNGCWWEDYPYNNQVLLTSLRCAPGDEIFVDVSQSFYGETQSRVVVEDLTTSQSTGWLDEYTPDLAANPSAEFLAEANTSLGAPPTSFDGIGFAYPEVVNDGYYGYGGNANALNVYDFFGWVSETNSLQSVIPGVWLSTYWPGNDIEVVS